MQDLDLIPLRHGYANLSSSTTTECALADTYYKIGGTWTAGTHDYFESDGSGKTTYKDGSGVHFLLNGVSDVSADKNCTIWYGLYINGTLVDAAQTPHTFNNANQISNISITAVLEDLQYNDYLEVWCKSDTVNTNIKSETLELTFWGDR